MDLISRISQHFADSAQTKLDAMELLAAPLAGAAEMMVGALVNNGKILACGIGGSAADAQHFAAELVGRFELERQGLAAIALTTDSSALTAIGNDIGFEKLHLTLTHMPYFIRSLPATRKAKLFSGST